MRVQKRKSRNPFMVTAKPKAARNFKPSLSQKTHHKCRFKQQKVLPQCGYENRHLLIDETGYERMIIQEDIALITYFHRSRAKCTLYCASGRP